MLRYLFPFKMGVMAFVALVGGDGGTPNRDAWEDYWKSTGRFDQAGWATPYPNQPDGSFKVGPGSEPAFGPPGRVPPPPPPPAPSRPAKFVKSTVKVERKDIPPVPPMTEITLTTDEKVNEETFTFWLVMPIDKVTPVEMYPTSCVVRVRSDAPETVYTYAWIANEKGKAQRFQVGTFKAGTGPQPPPGPDPTPPGPGPTPPPTPDVTKLPFPAAGFYCLFLKQDTEAKDYTASQKAGIWGEAVANYLNAKATPSGAESWPSWRIYDVDQMFSKESDPFWKDAWGRAVADYATWKAKNPGKSTPWMLCGNGTKGYSGPVDPSSLDATLATLKTYGGN